MKKALISGITGQDGSYLAEFLLQKGYEVHGILRRSSSFNTGRIEHLYFDEWVRDMKQKRTINLHYGDMTDSSSLIRIIQQVQPDEIYNLAAQSHVKVSFDVPEYTAEADAIGTLRMLEAKSETQARESGDFYDYDEDDDEYYEDDEYEESEESATEEISQDSEETAAGEESEETEDAVENEDEE